MKPFYYINNATIGEFTGEKFDTLERATEESLELAEANPGQSFEILKCVGHSSTSNASTFWMDGEEPQHPFPTMRPGWPGIDREELPEKPRYRMMFPGQWTLPSDEYETPRNSGIWKPVENAPYELSEYNNPHRRPL